MVLRWGIVSASKISNDFVTALKNALKTDHVITAIAAKDKVRAEEFAAKYGIPCSYGSYEGLAADSNIDVVYVGALNPQHFQLSKLMLDNGKHVLCEKPLCMNYKQTEELLKFAKKKGLFLMEAVWSRFFPVYEQLRKFLLNGMIGDVVQMTVNFGLLIEADRVKLKKMGGSSVLDIGVYPLQLALLVFGTNTPYELISAGHLNENHVDESFTSVIKYSEGKTATLVLHTRVKLENDAYIYGTKGYIKIHEPFWCPTHLTINGETLEFPLPRSNEGVYNYVNSVGLHYQAKEVYNCIKEGLLESPLMSHDDSLALAKMEDTIRKQLGVKFDEDEN